MAGHGGVSPGGHGGLPRRETVVQPTPVVRGSEESYWRCARMRWYWVQEELDGGGVSRGTRPADRGDRRRSREEEGGARRRPDG